MLVTDLIEQLQQLPATAVVVVRVNEEQDAVLLDAVDYAGGQVRILLDWDELADAIGFGRMRRSTAPDRRTR